jgi:cellulose synthase/poly-beta-1,6-N-acetylglucosamine synthase-like glycosyltransferase
LNELIDYINSNSLNWEIIVSIDGNDGTEEIVKGYSEKFSFIKYDKKAGRNGKGNSIKRVLPLVKNDYVLLMDADGSIKFNEIIKNLHYLDSYDVIIFDRYSNHDNDIPLMRRIPSRGFNILVRVLLNIDVRDTQCGFKVIRSDLMKRAFSNVSVTNTFFDVALLFYIKMYGGRIIEIPVNYKHDEDSKFNVVSEIVGQGVSLLAFTIRHSRFYKYIPDWARNLYYRKFRWI